MVRIHQGASNEMRSAREAPARLGSGLSPNEADVNLGSLAPDRCQNHETMAMSTDVPERRPMSVDHSNLTVKLEAPFLHVRPGHFVIVGGDHVDQGDWWMGQVIFCEGSARQPKLPSLFQVADVDTGVVKWINADEVSDVIWSMDGWPGSTTIQSKACHRG